MRRYSWELRTVFVEADIIGELSHLSCVDYVMTDPRIQKHGISAETVEKMLLGVGFGELDAGANMIVDRLSGGWRMKLALARAMCLNADILLMVRGCTFTSPKLTTGSPRLVSALEARERETLPRV